MTMRDKMADIIEVETGRKRGAALSVANFIVGMPEIAHAQARIAKLKAAISEWHAAELEADRFTKGSATALGLARERLVALKGKDDE
jgi:hypothetical protein